MARYIDVDKLQISIKNNFTLRYFKLKEEDLQLIKIFEIINTQPIADVVQVIRCKDCQHWNPIGFAENGGWCEKKDIAALHNGFCESGERKSDE